MSTTSLLKNKDPQGGINVKKQNHAQYLKEQKKSNYFTIMENNLFCTTSKEDTKDFSLNYLPKHEDYLQEHTN